MGLASTVREHPSAMHAALTALASPYGIGLLAKDALYTLPLYAVIFVSGIARGFMGPALFSTDTSGDYAVSALTAGMYRVIARARGFSDAVQNISFATDADTAEVGFVLRLGNLQSEVTVTASRNTRDALVVPLRAESLSSEAIAVTNPASGSYTNSA